MGHINYYRDYMPMLAHHTTPLYDALGDKGKIIFPIKPYLLHDLQQVCFRLAEGDPITD